MSIIKLSVYRPVLMTMFVMAFVVMGLFSFLELGVELFPQVDFPFVTVQTVYIGAGPEEVENLITKLIEEEVSAINGVKTITSTSIEGASIIAIEFELGTSVDIAALDVKDKIEGIKYRLPEDAEDPAILKLDFGAQPVVSLAVSGQRPLDEIFEITEDVIKPVLMKIQGLASINIIGGKKREIQVRLRREMLRSQDVGLTDVIIALATSNMSVPSGRIIEGNKEYSIRVSGEFESVDQIYDIILSLKNNRIVRLRDIAYVSDDFEEQRQLVRFNTNSSVGVSLIKRSDANIVAVVDEVINNLDDVKALLPQDMTIEVASDNSIFIRQSIAEVVNNMGIGIILTGLILFLFLHTWQGTIVAAVAMPTSIVATFILIRFAGFSLNFMTLLGLAVTIGVLVTNSIVVLENIIRYAKQGMEIKEASVKGTNEIATAVAASALTNIVVFTPIAFMGGIVGQFFYSFGLTVAFATIFSLFVSFTLTPMLASKMLGAKKELSYGFDLFALLVLAFILSSAAIGISVTLGSFAAPLLGSAASIVAILIGLAAAGILSKTILKPEISDLREKSLFKVWKFILGAILAICGLALNYMLFNYLFGTIVGIFATAGLVITVLLDKTFDIIKKFSDFWNRSYDNFANDYKKSLAFALKNPGPVLFIIVLIFIVSLSLAGFVGSEFLPGSDQGYISVALEMPPGVNINQTDKTLAMVETILDEIPEIASFYSVLGESPGTFFGKNQGVQYSEIVVKLVPATQRLVGSQEIIDRLTPMLTRIPSAEFILMKKESGGGQSAGALQLEITGDDIDVLNDISKQVFQIAKSIPGAIDIKTSLKEGVPEIEIVPNRQKLADYGISIATLATDVRSTIDGNIASKYRVGNKEYDIRVKLDKSYLANSEMVNQISVKKEKNFIPVSDLATINRTEGPTSVLRKNKQRLVIVSLNTANRPLGDIVNDIDMELQNVVIPPGYNINYGGDAEIQAESFQELLKTLILAIILAFLVLAAIMESYIHPLIIMMTLPLGLIGVIISLVITGKTLSIFSFMAMVMLVGIVVNNGILMIDYMQELRKEGKTLVEAIIEAASVRLRPIIMTNLATAMSMLPLALELGEGAEMRSPMAIVSIGALITSTIFTLYLVPVLYNLVEGIKVKTEVK